MSDRILGIDPAGDHLAFAALYADGRIASTHEIRTKERPGPNRLAFWREEIYAGRWSLLKDTLAVVVEIPWGPRPHFGLLSTAAVIIEACAAASLVPVLTLTTSDWKKRSVGVGNASKAAVMEHARRAFGYSGASQDLADALCMAEAGWQMYRRSLAA